MFPLRCIWPELAQPSDKVIRGTLPADLPVFENRTNLDQLRATGFLMIALPMKIAGGSGGPLRIVAMVPESRQISSNARTFAHRSTFSFSQEIGACTFNRGIRLALARGVINLR